MAVHHIVVQVDGDRACGDRLRYALGMARRLSASIEGVFARQPPNVPMVAEAGIAAEVADSQRTLVEQVAHEAERLFNEAAAGQDKAVWVAEDGVWTEVLTRRSRGADLVIVGQHNPNDPDGTAGSYLATDVTMSAGRPVLVLPFKGLKPGAGAEPVRRAIFAWKAGREAIRAAADARPLLEGAEVEVFRVVPRNGAADDTNGQDIATYLSRHGLNVRHHAEPAGDQAISETVLSRAAASGADLLIMGGYSHSRLRQAILGGMTRDILRNMTLPVMLSH